MIKTTRDIAAIEIELLLAQLVTETNNLVDVMILEAKRKITQGYTKRQAVAMITNQFDMGTGYMQSWTNKQNRIMQIAYKNVIQNTNKNRIDNNEKVKWTLDSTVDNCVDCIYMASLPAQTKAEYLSEGFGLPGDGLTKCSVGCFCMLERLGN